MPEKDPPREKDGWDKAATLSPLITGILVAIVGGTFTGVYSCREQARLEQQSAADDERKKYEIEVSKATQQHQNRILEMEAIERFFPHLTGTNALGQKVAIVTIAKLASPEIATEISKACGTDAARDGADIVNTSIAARPDASALVTQPSPAAGQRQSDQWVYLGEYVAKDGVWRKQYFEFGRRDVPESLVGRTLRIRGEVGALNVRDRPLGDIVTYAKPERALEILAIQNYAQLGYMWAHVPSVKQD